MLMEGSNAREEREMRDRGFTGMMPRVKSVGYVYRLLLSVFLRIFCSVVETPGIGDAKPVVPKDNKEDRSIGDRMV